MNELKCVFKVQTKMEKGKWSISFIGTAASWKKDQTSFPRCKCMTADKRWTTRIFHFTRSYTFFFKHFDFTPTNKTVFNNIVLATIANYFSQAKTVKPSILNIDNKNIHSLINLFIKRQELEAGKFWHGFKFGPYKERPTSLSHDSSPLFVQRHTLNYLLFPSQ